MTLTTGLPRPGPASPTSSKRTQELYHQLETAKEAINAIGGDGAVARLEGERRTCLLDIQERARDYVRTPDWR